MPEPLPDYRVTARNTSRHGENQIHDDAVARRLGFRGALVPGVTVYAHMTHPLVRRFGVEWLEHARVAVKFLKPVYEGDEVTVRARIGGETLATFEITASNDAGETCAVATGAVREAGEPVDVGQYPPAPLPATRPPAVRPVIEALDILGTPERHYDLAVAAEYTDAIGDRLTVYRTDLGHVHPAFLLYMANRALDQNVKLSAWVHVGSDVRHLGGARIGERLEARSRVRRVFEKKGHQFVTLDVLVVASDHRPVALVHHTAIYQLATADAIQGDPAPVLG